MNPCWVKVSYTVYVAGEASLHGALVAGQGDTNPLGLGPALTLHLLAADDLVDLLLWLA